eukprot:TRINITY_DN9334_c0_g1_i9.p1 TRINITY_DN9334_c0_g1~~TRINITY_DN9334_c0_g1_i9.p1  ORF type:complete len:668 (-),score=155.87 TRINITY_DN9334_c0_g1_i9:146-2149(-)
MHAPLQPMGLLGKETGRLDGGSTAAAFPGPDADAKVVAGPTLSFPDMGSLGAAGMRGLYSAIGVLPGSHQQSAETLPLSSVPGYGGSFSSSSRAATYSDHRLGCSPRSGAGSDLTTELAVASTRKALLLQATTPAASSGVSTTAATPVSVATTTAGGCMNINITNTGWSCRSCELSFPEEAAFCWRCGSRRSSEERLPGGFLASAVSTQRTVSPRQARPMSAASAASSTAALPPPPAFEQLDVEVAAPKCQCGSVFLEGVSYCRQCGRSRAQATTMSQEFVFKQPLLLSSAPPFSSATSSRAPTPGRGQAVASTADKGRAISKAAPGVGLVTTPACPFYGGAADCAGQLSPPSSPSLASIGLPADDCGYAGHADVLVGRRGSASSVATDTPTEPPILLQPLQDTVRSLADAVRSSQPADIKGKLEDMHSTFGTFGDVVQEDTSKRLEITKRRNSELLMWLAKIEKTMNVEIKRRSESVAETQQTIDAVLAGMMGHFQERIMGRFEQLHGTLEALGERCCNLERGIRQFKGELPSKLQVETSALSRTIKDLISQFNANKRQSSDRDTLLAKQIQDAEDNVDIRMQKELAQIELWSETLQELIEDFAAADSSPEFVQRRAIAFEKINDLKARLAQEIKLREGTDDRVVQAINEYTTSLHRSLQRANITV